MPFIPDPCQQQVIEITSGRHLVLAPPGCGKTQILTERVRLAHERGVEYGDMLCLTFTNRAARGMRERIGQYLGKEETGALYVGNLHRFCSRFLYENRLVAAETSVIDDDDAVSILARYLDEEEDRVKEDFQRRRLYADTIQLAHLMHQIAHRHDRRLRLHPAALTSEDVAALRHLCGVAGMAFTPEATTDIYEHTDHYAGVLAANGGDYGIRLCAERLLHKMRYAHAYTAYCRKYHLIDFEDLLILTYDALTDTSRKWPRYPWIQIDEVQDLNAMQLAIVDLLATPEEDGGTVMYLGDGQQAIFAFMGAKGDTLSALARRCEGHIHRLDTNHRSPRYLLRVLNDYAARMLGTDPALLPTTTDQSPALPGALRLMSSETEEGECRDVARLAHALAGEHPDETTAIIVSTNAEADKVSQQLTALQTNYFKVSGADIFAAKTVKLLLAHLGALQSPTAFMDWARIVWGLGVYRSYPAARAFVRKLLDRAILPSDLLMYEGETYTGRFAHDVGEGEAVVFDTETTGLDVLEDDILQIAAVKTRGGVRVPGSELCLYIETGREIPAMLGDTPNPILEERRHHRLYTHAEALARFMDYVGELPVVGHNVEYDVQILTANVERYLPARLAQYRALTSYDTLLLLRLCQPGLPSYRLDYFREAHLFGISEDNAHLADVDVADTVQLVAHCLALAREALPRQTQFLADKGTQQHASSLRQLYRERYMADRERLYKRQDKGGESALARCMRTMYRETTEQGLAEPIEKIEYVLGYIDREMVAVGGADTLAGQLHRHLLDIGTLKEADLCGSSVVADRIFLSTVHKAKGLEFDNVIVYDVTDSHYPNYYSRGIPSEVEEDKRKLYVALSRARRRICLAWATTRTDYRGCPQPRGLSPFLTPILRYFDS